MSSLGACLVAGLFYFGSPPPPADSAVSTNEAHKSWVRELELGEDVGGATDVLFTTSDDAVWLAVTGATTGKGRARVYRRDPKSAHWVQRWEGPTATDLRFQEAPGGAVHLSMGHPLQAFRPRILDFGNGENTDPPVQIKPPLERLDDNEYRQVGALWLDDAGQGWACGQEGALWRRTDDGRGWQLRPFPLQTDEARKGERYCSALEMDAMGVGHLSTIAGKGAWFDGFDWHPMRASEGGAVPRALGNAPTLARLDGDFFRAVDARWVRLENQCPELSARALAGAPILIAAGGGAGIAPEHLLHFGTKAWTCETKVLDIPVRTLTTARGLMFVLSEDGVYRSTTEQLLRMTPAPGGGLPTGLQYPLAVDLNDDGMDELVAVLSTDLAGQPSSQSLGGELAVYRALGGGDYRRDPEAGPVARATLKPGVLGVGDIDGDADLDYVLVNEALRAEVWRDEGTTFSRVFVSEAPTPRVSLVDLEGDGDLDLVAGAKTWLNDGGGGFRAGPSEVGEGDLSDWADVDGDGDADSVARFWRDNSVFYENRHAQGEGLVFTPHEIDRPQETGQFVDLDHDGALELLAGLVHVQDRALPFSICELSSAAQDGVHCERGTAGATPPGLIADLDRDGHQDLVVGSVRADEIPFAGGAVYLRDRAAALGAWHEVTYASGKLVRPTFLDADGDGDLDVYSTVSGLKLNRNDPNTWVRIHVRAPHSDARAEDSRVRIEDATGKVVASARTRGGVAVLGLPQADAEYRALIDFAAGGGSARFDVHAGDTRWARPLEGVTLRLAQLRRWFSIASARAELGRDVLVPAVIGVVFASIVAWWFGGFQWALLSLGLCAVSWLGFVGWTVRAPGSQAWLLGLWMLLGAGLALTGLWTFVRRRARRFAGPYRLLRTVGRGAAATVWHARRAQKDVALKLFDAGLMESRDSRERFFREAKIGHAIESDHLVRVEAFGALDDGRCYLAMELIRGGSLAQRLARGPLTWRAAAKIGADVARGLRELHAAGAVHRDLKPANILLREDGRALVADLGLARSELAKTITRHELAVGTLAYMSPEQAIGAPLDGRSDLWALGVVLYQATTGTLPFAAEHELELLHLIHNVVPSEPHAHNPDLSPGFNEFVVRCLARRAEGRPRDAQDAINELEAMLSA